MASTVNDFSVNQYPPSASLPSVLLASHSSTLAARVFGADTGYPSGLALGAALKDNDSGHFNLVSGLTVAGSAASIAQAELERIQGKYNEIQLDVAALSKDDLTDSLRNYHRERIKDNIEDIRQSIQDAGVGEFNLLDAFNSRGVKLDVNTGALSNAGVTPRQSVGGHDNTFDYQSHEVAFQTVDLNAATDDLSQLESLTYPGTSDALNSNGTSYTLTRFQSVIDQSRSSLNQFRQKLTQTALENVTISGDPSQDTITDPAQARQIASRLAEQLSQESFNISASPSARYFSLFT